MKAKRILSMVLALCICVTLLPELSLQTTAISYSGSASYMSGKYYKQLCAVTLTGNSAVDIANVAKSQIGYQSGASNNDLSGSTTSTSNVKYSEYGRVIGSNPNDWCAYFVSWCARQAGISTSILPNFAGCTTAYNTTLPNAGCAMYRRGTCTPQVGDIIFFGTSSTNIYHVGIVTSSTSTTVYYIDGNNTSTTPHCVHNSSRSLSDSSIWGYARPKYPNPSVKHTVDTSYETNFTAYPKSKITAENIFDAYHGQIDSTSWIGTSDKCTIHEVYTDGCCKVTYPLDAGGTKTVYSKIALFNINTHTHSYTGSRYHESEHPHAIWQKCVDYDTCGGWIYTGEYYEKNTCEQCWYADFEIGASSVSLKVGESKAIAASLSGCLPDSVALDRYFSPDNGVAEVTIKNQQAIFTGLKEGTTYFRMYLYSDSSKSYLLDAVSIRVDVTATQYTVFYNANGGTGAPSKQTKYHGTPLVLSSVKPSREGYTFLGWSESYSTNSADYQPGGTFDSDYSTTLYAVWKMGCENGKHNYNYKETKVPTTSSTGTLHGYCTKCSATATVTLPKLNTTDYTYTVVDEPTCTGTGTGCYTLKNTTYGNQMFAVSIPATGHSYSYKATKTPTTSATGTLTGTCSKCSGTTTVTLPKLNTTDYTYSVRTAATCTSAGTGCYTWKTTTYGSFYFDVSLAKLGHSYSYKATKTPATSATGTLTGTCSKCSGTTTVTLPKLNTTDYSYSVKTAATCTEVGSGRYTWKTTTYGSFYFDVTISKLGHNYSNGSCARCGAEDPSAEKGKYEITNATGAAGSTVEVYVSITNNPGVISLRNTISYDTSALELISVQDCCLLAGYTTPSATINSPYTLRWADSLATQNNTSNGRIVKLVFQIKDNVETGNYSISVTPVEARNVNGGSVSFNEASATVTVIDCMIGDTDGDGEVTDWDAIVLNRYLAGWNVTIEVAAADVDDDGEVTDWDAIVLDRYLAGWNVTIG